MVLGFLFGLLFGLRVSEVVYMGYFIMMYCWWHAALQIGGDGCHNFAHLFHSSSPSEFDIFLEEVPILVTAVQNAILMARASEEEEVRTAFGDAPGKSSRTGYDDSIFLSTIVDNY